MTRQIGLPLFLCVAAGLFWNASASIPPEIQKKMESSLKLLNDKRNDERIESLINQLSSGIMPPELVRHNATRQLVQIGKPAVPKLVRALPQASGQLSYDIVEIFYQMGTYAEEAVPVLIAELKRPNFSIFSEFGNYHRKVSWALGEIGHAAVPSLIDALSYPNNRTRQYAAESLQYMGFEARAAVPALLPLLQDEYAEVRRAAAVALGETGKRGSVTLGNIVNPTPRTFLRRRDHPAHAAVPSLIQMLEDDSSYVRRAAVNALGDIADASAVPGLIAMLKKEDKRARGLAARALGKIGAPAQAAVPVLISRLKMAGYCEKGDIIEGLGGIGTLDVVPVLQAFLDDESDYTDYTRRIAAAELQKLGVWEIQDFLDDGETTVEVEGLHRDRSDGKGFVIHYKTTSAPVVPQDVDATRVNRHGITFRFHKALRPVPVEIRSEGGKPLNWIADWQSHSFTITPKSDEYKLLPGKNYVIKVVELPANVDVVTEKLSFEIRFTTKE